MICTTTVINPVPQLLYTKPYNQFIYIHHVCSNKFGMFILA